MSAVYSSIQLMAQTKLTEARSEWLLRLLTQLASWGFRSTYENHTEHDQDHSFQTERTTVSCCTTTVSKGFTKGVHLEVLCIIFIPKINVKK
jgi:hypothetical protein